MSFCFDYVVGKLIFFSDNERRTASVKGCFDYVVGRRTTMLLFLLLPQLQTLGPLPLPLASGAWPVKKNCKIVRLFKDSRMMDNFLALTRD